MLLHVSRASPPPPGPAWYTWSLFVSGVPAWGFSGGVLLAGGRLHNEMFHVGFSNVYCFCVPSSVFSVVLFRFCFFLFCTPFPKILTVFPYRFCSFCAPFLHFFPLFLPGYPCSHPWYLKGILGDLACRGWGAVAGNVLRSPQFRRRVFCKLFRSERSCSSHTSDWNFLVGIF